MPTRNHVFEPVGDAGAAAVVLLQEYWGINAHVKSLGERLAREGFLTVAPDLYHGKVASTSGEAGKLMQLLDWTEALREIGEAVEAARAHPRSSGKVGVIGFCMGGALTFAAACNVRGLGAAVPFYGVPPMAFADWSKLTAPVQAHFAANDGWAKVDLAEDIEKKILARRGAMELYVYDAQHAFMNDTRPEVFDARNAALAWTRAVTFLRKHLT